MPPDSFISLFTGTSYHPVERPLGAIIGPYGCIWHVPFKAMIDRANLLLENSAVLSFSFMIATDHCS